ncbi:MAG: YDG domain-containing protein, partial [Pseudomonadota bacterium]
GGASAGVTGATTLTATTANADVGEVTLNGALNVNALTLNAAASITQANAVKATSLAATLTGASSALTLSSSGNQITTLNTITTPGGFTLNNGNNNVTVAGTITATNHAVAIDAGTGGYTQNANIDVVAGTGAISVIADTVAINTTNTGNNAFSTSGTLTLKPKTAGQAMSLGGASAFDLSATEVARFASGATGPIVIGDTASTGVLTIGGVGVPNLSGKTVTLNAGSMTDTGVQAITALNLTLNANGQIGTDSTNGIDVGAATNLNVNTTNNGNAFVRSTAAINFGAAGSGSSVAGTLDVTTTGNVTQTAGTGNIAAGTLKVKTLSAGTATVTLTNTGNDAGAIHLQSRNAGDTGNVAGAIQYTDSNGFDVAALSTTGNASLSAGGSVTQSGAINAAGLALKGAGGAYTLRHAGNAVTTLAANTGSIDYSQANALAVGTVAGVVGVDNTGVAKLETTGAASDLTLNAVVKSAASGDAVVLKAGSSNAAGVVTGGKFVNSVGAGAIVTAAGRYLVYTGDPGTTNEIVTGFSKRYNTAASFTPGGSGSMFLYRVAPTLTITSDNASKIYGQDNPVFTGSSSGYIDGDTAASVGVTRTSAAVFNTPVAQSGIAITSGATNNENYTLVLSHGALQIDKASISSVSGIRANDKVVDGNTSATLNTGGAVYNGIVAGDVLTVSGVGNFDTPFVGSNKLVLIRDLALGGAAADNYTLVDKTATTRAAINDLSSFAGALLPPAPPPQVARVTPASLTVADANALLEQAPTASGGCVEGTGSGCLSVSTVREATDQAPGLVSVMVASSVTGFQFKLPSSLAALIRASDAPVDVLTIGGRPLPDWLRYDAATQTFVALSPPPGALPMQIRVRVGNRSVILTIARAPDSTPAPAGVVVKRLPATALDNPG